MMAKRMVRLWVSCAARPRLLRVFLLSLALVSGSVAGRAEESPAKPPFASLQEYIAPDCLMALLASPARMTRLMIGGQTIGDINLFQRLVASSGLTSDELSKVEALLYQVWARFDLPDEPMEVGLAVRWRSPPDQEAMLLRLIGSHEPVRNAGLQYVRGLREQPRAAAFLDDRTLLIAPASRFESLYAAKGQPSSVASLLAKAGAADEFAMVIDIGRIPPEKLQELFGSASGDGPAEMAEMAQPLQRIGQGSRALFVRLDFGPSLVARVGLRAADENSAESVETGLAGVFRALQSFFTQQLETTIKAQPNLPPDQLAQAEAQIKKLLEALSSMMPKRQGLWLTSTLENPATVGLAAALMIPALQASRVAETRATSANRLRHLAAALEAYRAEHGDYPRDIRDPAGNPLLSWRVLVLPYLNSSTAKIPYQRDRAWDDPANAALLAAVPVAFQHPHQPGDNTTVYLRPIGPGSAFAEGASHDRGATPGALAIVVDASLAIPWTRPGDFEVPAAGEISGLQTTGGGSPVAFGNGQVRLIPRDLDPELLRRALRGAE